MSDTARMRPRQPQRLPWTPSMFENRRLLVLGLQLDASTWRMYESAFNSWKAFIDIHHYPLEPSASTLSDYIMFMSDQIKMSSVVGYLAGITRYLEPIFPNVRNARDSKLVQDTITGCKRLRNMPIARKRPLELWMLQTIYDDPDPSYDNLLFKTLAVVGFHGLLRLGDLCDPSQRALINPAKSARRSSVRRLDNDAWTFTLPAHKADKFFEGNIILLKTLWRHIDVVAIFQQYLDYRDRRFPYFSPLWLTDTGTIPTREFFLSRLASFPFGDGLSGQSLQSGGATALAGLGAPAHAIQAIGRWSSEAWKIYVRKHPLIVYNFHHCP